MRLAYRVVLPYLSSQSEQALQEIANILNELGQRLTLFDIYSKSIELDPQLREAFFNILVNLLLNTVTAIKHFRKNDIQIAVMIATWTTVQCKFSQTLKNITTKVDHLQKLLEAQNITQLNRTQARLAQSLSQLNINISAGPQQSDINKIIGKSQIALKYAQQQWLAGTNVILWIASGTEAEIAKSFNKAASRLDLPGYLETNTPDQNRFAVLQWLQRSGRIPWLLILDNVEDQKVLSENWPRTGNGSILVTCRSEILAASPAAVTIEIPAFTIDKSGELIINIMNRKNASEDENLAAHELSEKLGGLALAIDIVTKQIKTRKRFKTIRDFLPFENVKLELLNLSLIRINEETGLISLHRLTQHAFFDRMSEQERKDAFKVAFSLLREAFPGQQGHHHLYTRWQTCEQLRQHVLAFQAQYEVLRKDSFSEQDPKFTWLICDTAWYLLEIQSFIDCERTLLLTEDNIEDKTSLAYAYLCTNFVSLYKRTGRSVRAIPKAKKALEIRESSATDKNNLANGFSDVGYSSVAAYEAEQGLQYLEKALAFTKAAPEPDRYKVYNIDRFLRNHGRGNMLLGHYDEAKADFNKAEYYQPIIHGKNSHYDREIMHERAKIAARHSNFNKAYNYNEQAYKLMSPGKPTHSSVMATRYQQGWVAIQRGNEVEALRYFRDALTICQLNKAQRGNKGESARVKWRMSQIMENQGLADEAKTYREAGEETKKELTATGDYPKGITEDNS
ncbi:MAG: hypothetical protein Q9210_005582 [Variospora velana]